MSEARTFKKRDVKLGYLIHDVSRLRRNAFDRLMKPLGVTRSQWWVLAYLSRDDGMAQTRLAELLDIGKASLGSLLDRLEAGGWVDRCPDPVDRRVKRVFLTRSSRQLLRKMSAADQVFDNRVLGGLSETEREHLITLLGRIKQTLSKMETNPSGMRSGDGRSDAKGETMLPPAPRNRSARGALAVRKTHDANGWHSFAAGIQP